MLDNGSQYELNRFKALAYLIVIIEQSSSASISRQYVLDVSRFKTKPVTNIGYETGELVKKIGTRSIPDANVIQRDVGLSDVCVREDILTDYLPWEHDLRQLYRHVGFPGSCRWSYLYWLCAVRLATDVYHVITLNLVSQLSYELTADMNDSNKYTWVYTVHL